MPVQKPVVEAPELKDLSRELEDIQDKANPNTSIKGNLTLLFHFLCAQDLQLVHKWRITAQP